MGKAPAKAKVICMLFLNLRTKPGLAISWGHKDGSFMVDREGQFGPAGADDGHQGE